MRPCGHTHESKSSFWCTPPAHHVPSLFFFSILILPRHTTQREERERKRGTSCQVLMRKHEDVQRKRKTVFLLRLLHCVACLILLFFFRLRVSACVCSSYNLFRGSKPDLIVECVYYIRPSKRERDRGRHRERVFFPSFFIHDVATVTMTATTATAKKRFFFYFSSQLRPYDFLLHSFSMDVHNSSTQ